MALGGLSAIQVIRLDLNKEKFMSDGIPGKHSSKDHLSIYRTHAGLLAAIEKAVSGEGDQPASNELDNDQPRNWNVL
jgi:hypothetical protein